MEIAPPPKLPNIFEAVWDGLRRIAVFTGRDSSPQFWTYAGVVLVIGFVVGSALIGPSLNNTMLKMQQFAVAHPDQATVQSSPTSYSIQVKGRHPELMGDTTATMRQTAWVGIPTIILLAAAIVRRLHDRGRSGFWALPPLPFFILSAALTPSFIAAWREPLSWRFFGLVAVDCAYSGSLLLLAMMLFGRSARGSNRYGPEPQDDPI